MSPSIESPQRVCLPGLKAYTRFILTFQQRRRPSNLGPPSQPAPHLPFRYALVPRELRHLFHKPFSLGILQPRTSTPHAASRTLPPRWTLPAHHHSMHPSPLLGPVSAAAKVHTACRFAQAEAEGRARYIRSVQRTRGSSAVSLHDQRARLVPISHLLPLAPTFLDPRLPRGESAPGRRLHDALLQMGRCAADP